jgi:hypothetical protein
MPPTPVGSERESLCVSGFLFYLGRLRCIRKEGVREGGVRRKKRERGGGMWKKWRLSVVDEPNKSLGLAAEVFKTA